MELVDNVTTRLKAERQRIDARTTELLHTMSLGESRQRAFPEYTSDGFRTKYGGKANHRGRITWTAVVGPLSPTSEVVDYLPAGVSLITWSFTDERGERRVWMKFKTLVEHQTVRKILRSMDLDVVYINGCKLKEVEEALLVNGVNKIVSE